MNYGSTRAEKFCAVVLSGASKQESECDRIEVPALSGRSEAAAMAVEMMIKTLQQAKRYLRIVFGFTLLAIGVVMIVTPGPGTITILIALGVLAAEFVWARRLLDRLKQQSERLRNTVFPPADRAA